MSRKLKYMIAFMMMVVLANAVSLAALAQTESDAIPIEEWEMLWEPAGSSWSVEDVRDSREWFAAGTGHPFPAMPEGITDGWVRIELPEMGAYRTPGLYFPTIYGHNFEVYLADNIIYETFWNSNVERHQFVLPLNGNAGEQQLYMRIEGVLDRIGFDQNPQLGEFQSLNQGYIGRNIPDMILAGGFFFVACIMLVCVLFLKREQRTIWLSLALVILSSGLFIVTHSRFVYAAYDQFATLLGTLFDLAMMTFTICLTLFVEQIIQGKFRRIVRIYRIIQSYYACVYFLAMLVNLISDGRMHDLYFFIAVTVMSVFLLVQMGILLTASITQAWRGNREAQLFSAGLAIFGALSIIDLVLFTVRDMNYELVLYKWGLAGFIMAMIVLLCMRLANDHSRLIRYSKELELFNNQLQHSEKMQIISELAASVAHEVRNPLQVTRGFLQLLRVNTTDKKKKYLDLALDELDRASEIITDFLTFAKPQLDQVTTLHLATEMKHIEGVLLPLTNLQGGELKSEIGDDLYIRGNSAKFKQALINIIKNSVEALTGKGQIRVFAEREMNDVIIVIRDNGEGMDEDTVAKLGQPYFSTKTKGTGLGLMVTFRIIEVMEGTINFSSKLGVGTEVIIRFPSTSYDPGDG